MFFPSLTIKDSIILNDVVIGKNCHIEKTIIDKNTVIGDNSIIGTGDDYTPNKDNAKVLSSGINVIGKKLVLPEGLVIERNVRIFSSTNTKTISTKHISPFSPLPSNRTICPTSLNPPSPPGQYP